MADSGSRSRFMFLEADVALPENDDEDEVYECESLIRDEECLQILLDKERERDYVQSPVDDWIKVARSDAIQWIINTRALLRFRFRTAYLSVVYIDRLLSKGLIDNDKHWAIRLLPVACLSLAMKMKEHNIPALSQFPIEEYKFESRIIQRMELLILTTLQWRINSVTPFDFIHFFISRFCKESPKRNLVSLTTQIVFATTKDMNLMGHRSSTIAMAATLLAMDQNFTKQSLEIQLNKATLNRLFDFEDVYACYNRMLELEPVKVTISKPHLDPSGSSGVGTKRKRLTFGDLEKKPNR